MAGTVWGVYSGVKHCVVSYGEVVKGIGRTTQALLCHLIASVRYMNGLVEDCMITTWVVNEEPVSPAD